MAITFTLKKSSEESGLAVRTLYQKIASGELPSVKVGRRRLIPAKALEEFLLRGMKSQAPKREPATDDGLKLTTPRREVGH